MSGDSYAQFVAQLRRLRDRTLVAIEEGRSGQLEEGLTLYRTLLGEAVLGSRPILVTESGSVPSNATWQLDQRTYGREWQALLRDVYDFAGAAGTERRGRVWQALVEFNIAAVTDASRHAEIPAAASHLRVLAHMWQLTLVSRNRAEKLDAQYALTLGLDNFAAYTVPQLQDRALQDDLLKHVAGTFGLLLKAAVDEGDEESGLDGLRASQAMIEAAGFRRDPEWLATFRSAILLTVMGWSLLSANRSGVRPVLYQALLHDLQSADVWKALLEALDNEFGFFSSSRWWELPEREARSSGTIVMPTHVRAAAVLTGRLRPPLPGDATAEDAELARVLLNDVDDVEAGRYGDQTTTYDTQMLKERLRGLVSWDEQQRRAMLIASDLQPAAVAVFRDVVLKELALSHPERLSSLLPTSWFEPAGDDDNDVLGADLLVPKDYFVDQPGVYANPESLAQSLAGSLRRFEDDLLVGLLVDAVVVRTQIADWATFASDVQTHVARTFPEEDAVLVTNTWQAVEHLRVEPGSGDLRLLTARGDKLYRRYDDNPPFVLAFSRPHAISLRRRPLAPKFDGDAYLPDAACLTGVSTLPPQTVADLTASSGKTHEELMAAARVRVLEAFRAELLPDQRVLYWTLPSDAY